MKTVNKLVLLMILFASPLLVSGHGDAGVENFGEMIMINGAMKAPDLCDTPTAFMTISAPADNSADFDQDEYKVEKNTCYELTFSNPSIYEHDMQIDPVEGPNGIGWVALHVVDKFVGPNSDGKISMNFITPNADTEFEIYCTLPGHRAAGMEAKLIVGNGNPASDGGFLPGFAFVSALFSIMMIGIIVRKRK